jgi:hypothetical protein
LLVACDAPAVGTWESDAKLGNGKRNKLELLSDYTGSATVYATTCTACTDWTDFKFKVEWEEDGAEAVDLDMKCKSGPCDGNDFAMECEVVEEEDGAEKMDCKANGNWDAYPFDWERNE